MLSADKSLANESLGSQKTRSVGLYLSAKRGFYTLKCLIKEIGADQIAYVVSARDANVDHDYFDEISSLSNEHGIALCDKKIQDGLSSDFCLAVGWRTIISNLGDTPLIVIHDSVLPKYRGFNPVVTTLIEGDNILGATAFYASERYDEGDVIAQRSLEIAYPIKIASALDLLAELIGELSCDAVKAMRSGTAKATPQDHDAATFSIWRDEDDYQIDWKKDAAWIKRFIDAVGSPFKGASTIMTGGALVRILDSVVEEDVIVHDRARNLGKIIFFKDAQPVVICGSGLLRIAEMTDEGNQKSLLPLKKFRIRFE